MTLRMYYTLVTLSCLSLSVSAKNIVQKNNCNVATPVYVTYTTTIYTPAEYLTKEDAHNKPTVTYDGLDSKLISTVPIHQTEYSHYHPVDYASALSYNPHPVPIEYESCFNRSSTVEYAHSSYDQYYPSETENSHLPSGESHHIYPPYGNPNATSTYYPTGTGASSTVSVSKNTTVPTQPSCTPDIELEGASEYEYNKKDSPFTVKLTSCSSKFQVNSTTAFANFQAIPDLVISENAISFSGFADDYVLLSVFALDMSGAPVIKSWELHFGSINMPIRILNPDDTPAEGVRVEANATIYPGLSGGCTTDATGECTIENLPGTTIGLVARKDDNSIAVNGLAPTTVQVVLTLLPFITPNPDASFDLDNGTAGWTGGDLQQSLKIKRDTTLVVSTNAEYTLQSASNSFPTSEGTKKVFINYRFITSEVPGGFFGTQFNDYFSITIRSDTGVYVTVTNSMNALGLGAFDSTGATNVFTLTLDVPANTKSVMFNIGVSNVADNLYDSSLVVEKVGENKCDKCDSCEACPERPACQESCKNPPPQSCTFYADCAEKELNCGASGYPIRYGQKNCLAFNRNLDYFTAQGQSFIWGTMSCLQQFLSPLIQSCDETCASISTKAFASHPKCYTDNGFCSLGCGDILVLLAVVNKDLLESGEQIFDTAKICLTNALDTLKGCAGEILVGTAAAVTFGASAPWTIAAIVAGRYLGSLAGGAIGS